MIRGVIYTAKEGDKQLADNKTKGLYGGQAVIEGIMMMGPEKIAVVCRKDDGTLVTKEEDRKPAGKIRKIPFLRGVPAFCSSLYTGVKALLFSSDIYAQIEDEKPKDGKTSVGMTILYTLTMLVSVGITIGLFFILPTLLGSLVALITPSLVVRNVAESLLKIAILIGYMALAGLMPEMRRTYMYHGAEHKTIACLEAGLPLTVENVRKQTRFHPRCGTSFMFVIVFLNILVSCILFAIFPTGNAIYRVLIHLLEIPFVVSLGYEANRYAGTHEGSVCRLLRKPGLWLQRVTTREPEDEMIKVAIKSIELAGVAEENHS